MSRKQIIIKALWMTVGITLLLWGAFRIFQQSPPDFETLHAERFAVGRANKGDIWIAIAWEVDEYNKTFLDGVRTAINKINSEGGILGRKLRYHVFGGNAHSAAREIIADPRFLAVIGHETSGMAIPASITYQSGGILFIAPFATHPDLTAGGADLVIRSVPDDADMVRSIANEIAAQNMTNAAVVSVRNHYGMSLARLFNEAAIENGIQITYIGSYNSNQFDFRELAYQIKQHPFDCIVLADALPRAAYLIMQLREQHINVPVFGGDGLDSSLLWEIAGRGAENTYVASSYATPAGDSFEDRLNGAASEMDKSMLEAFGPSSLPDTYAASGYEAVMLYHQAVEATGIAIPIVVASTLKYAGPWQALNGLMTFDESGNVRGKPVMLKVVRDGRFDKIGKGENHATTNDNSR